MKSLSRLFEFGSLYPKIFKSTNFFGFDFEAMYRPNDQLIYGNDLAAKFKIAFLYESSY